MLVEDLMTDGGSKIKFIESILDVKANIKAIFVVFNYGINIDYIEVKKKNKSYTPSYMARCSPGIHIFKKSQKR